MTATRLPARASTICPWPSVWLTSRIASVSCGEVVGSLLGAALPCRLGWLTFLADDVKMLCSARASPVRLSRFGVHMVTVLRTGDRLWLGSLTLSMSASPRQRPRRTPGPSSESWVPATSRLVQRWRLLESGFRGTRSSASQGRGMFHVGCCGRHRPRFGSALHPGDRRALLAGETRD